MVVMEGLGQLDEAIATLASAASGPASLSDDELGSTLVALHRHSVQLRAIEARLTWVFDGRTAYRGDGARSTAAWLARRCRMSPRSAMGQAQLARWLAQMPLAAAALAAGEIDEHHVGVLAQRAESPRKAVAAAFAEAEADLVGSARRLPYADFVRTVRRWEDGIDPDGAEDQAERDHDARRLDVSAATRGNVVLDGQLDALGGSEVATALRRLELELLEADWDAAHAVHGDETSLDRLSRAPAQRRADALVAMARRATVAPAGSPPPVPLVNVLVDLETLAGRVCELINRTPVTPGQVARLLTRADIERVVFQGPDQLVEIGPREVALRDHLRQLHASDWPMQAH
jgi:hypothetical protein